MRLKTFHAATMADAMKLVRDELGEDSIIVSTNDNGRDGVRITAAVESPEPDLDFTEFAEAEKPLDAICDALDRHGTPRPIADRLLNTATLLGTTDTVQSFAGALDLLFEFNPLPETPPKRPIMVFGPPGSGKTSAVAKIATRAVVSRQPVILMTTDTLRAGAIEQLEAYGERLKVAVKTATEPPDLSKLVDQAAPGHLVLIDTTSVNPYSSSDMVRLSAFTDAVDAERLLVMNTGRDAIEAADMATEFCRLTPKRLLVTGIDLARRLGSLLAAADAAEVAFSEISETPEIVKGLRPVNPVALARLFLERSTPVGAAMSAHTQTQHQHANGWK